MPDIFLYTGEANPNDIRLSDPTVLRGGGGAPDVTSAITGALNFSAAASAREVMRGAVTGALNFGGTATAREVMRGTVAGALNFNCAASARELNQGAITGGLTFTGSASAREVIQGAATGALTFSATATAQQIQDVSGVIAGGLQFNCNATATAPSVQAEEGGRFYGKWRPLFAAPVVHQAGIRGGLRFSCRARGNHIAPAHGRARGGLTFSGQAAAEHYDRTGDVKKLLAALEL